MKLVLTNLTAGEESAVDGREQGELTGEVATNTLDNRSPKSNVAQTPKTMKREFGSGDGYSSSVE